MIHITKKTTRANLLFYRPNYYTFKYTVAKLCSIQNIISLHINHKPYMRITNKRRIQNIKMSPISVFLRSVITRIITYIGSRTDLHSCVIGWWCTAFKLFLRWSILGSWVEINWLCFFGLSAS